MGRPKALIPTAGGKTIIEHIADVASVVADETVLLGPAIQLPASLQALPVLPDARPDAGPLAGLCSLLEYAGDRWALLLACDMPRLDTAVLTRMLPHVASDADAVVYCIQNQPDLYHACCALYHPRALPVATDELDNGKGSLQRMLARLRKIVLQPSAQEARQLTNLNRPEDLQTLN
jgi:molybdopterin-guanine dinucleotide biosynthesis protein A